VQGHWRRLQDMKRPYWPRQSRVCGNCSHWRLLSFATIAYYPMGTDGAASMCSTWDKVTRRGEWCSRFHMRPITEDVEEDEPCHSKRDLAKRLFLRTSELR